MDKTVRDAGPFFATLDNGTRTGTDKATHMPVLIWYSPGMMAWLKKYRPADDVAAPKPPPVPDGAITIKEAYNSRSSSRIGSAPRRARTPTGYASSPAS